jgi:hypothetical protein
MRVIFSICSEKSIFLMLFIWGKPNDLIEICEIETETIVAGPKIEIVLRVEMIMKMTL